MLHFELSLAQLSPSLISASIKISKYIFLWNLCITNLNKIENNVVEGTPLCKLHDPVHQMIAQISHQHYWVILVRWSKVLSMTSQLVICKSSSRKCNDLKYLWLEMLRTLQEEKKETMLVDSSIACRWYIHMHVGYTALLIAWYLTKQRLVPPTHTLVHPH